jgi:hypothetical protein
MNNVRGVLGLIFLFLGREVNFLFAGGMAALLAYRISPLLPPTWPTWAVYAFILGLGLVAAATPFINERFGYVVSGLLGGGYFMSEYFAPGVAALPILPFIVGAGIGGIVMGVFTEWALMVISSIVGAYFVTDFFPRMNLDLKMMISGGLFLAGGFTQVMMRRMQQR